MADEPIRPRADDIRATLAGVCQSAMFRRAPSLARLLVFLIEADLDGQASELRETYVGCKLYGRTSDYDPKLDTVVRVSASRLRTRLEDYNFAHRDAELQIVLQKGSYVPVYIDRREPQGIDRREPQESNAELASESPIATNAEPVPEFVLVDPAVQMGRSFWWTGAVLLTLLTVGAAFAAVWHRRAPERGLVWQERPLSRPGGMAQFAEFSPDGRSVIFALSHGSEQSSALFSPGHPQRCSSAAKPSGANRDAAGLIS